MRDPNRLDNLYEVFHKIHKEKFPDLRAFQLFENFIGWAYEKTKIDPFFIEDDKFIELIKEYGKDK